MAHKAVARPLVVASVALWMAACLSSARAQPSAGTVPLLQSLVDLESVEVSMGELVPALPQEALAPATTLAEVLQLAKAVREKVEELFCTKPTVTRGKKVDTVIQGPQLNITVSGGNCSVAVDLGQHQKTLACVGPSISYSKAPITFTAKHWSADVFEDGSCVKTKPVGKQQGTEEKVLWSAGEHMRFESVEAFLDALKAGALNALFGPEAAAQMTQQAAAAAAAAAAARSMPVPATAAAAVVPTAAKPISLESLLQSAGWEVKMNKAAPTDDAPPAPGT